MTQGIEREREGEGGPRVWDRLEARVDEAELGDADECDSDGCEHAEALHHPIVRVSLKKVLPSRSRHGRVIDYRVVAELEVRSALDDDAGPAVTSGLFCITCQDDDCDHVRDVDLDPAARDALAEMDSEMEGKMEEMEA